MKHRGPFKPGCMLHPLPPVIMDPPGPYATGRAPGSFPGHHYLKVHHAFPFVGMEDPYPLEAGDRYVMIHMHATPILLGFCRRKYNGYRSLRVFLCLDPNKYYRAIKKSFSRQHLLKLLSWTEGEIIERPVPDTRFPDNLLLIHKTDCVGSAVFTAGAVVAHYKIAVFRHSCFSGHSLEREILGELSVRLILIFF
jgi:hypothetical protein